MPGCMRQNRSGQSAMNPRSATSAAVARIASFTPKISWISTTAPAGFALRFDHQRRQKLPEPSVACTVIVAIRALSLRVREA